VIRAVASPFRRRLGRAVVTDPHQLGNGDSSRANGVSGADDAAEARSLPRTLVRYGRTGFVGEFTHPQALRFAGGNHVIVQTDRGIELGRQIHHTCAACEVCVDGEQIRRYVDASGPEYLRENVGRILREATPEDLSEAEHLRVTERDRLAVCQQVIERHELPMKLVDCEHLFGGERLIFYFMAEGRIDFRELVRDLAREFQTRIEMRQVGARDEARLVADYETCGRECCCKNFLKNLKPITMKMAKMQKATLDPSKVSGRCGRLKCCLRYEHETYEELDAKLPRNGTRVRTATDEGIITERQILTQLLRIQTDDDRQLVVPVEDLLEIGLPDPERDPDAPPPRDGTGPRYGAQPTEDDTGATSTDAETDRPPDRGRDPDTREPRRRRRRRRGRRKRARNGGPDAGRPDGSNKPNDPNEES
jgi:cell fate regulator YaaT (PSP1 superfamily)